jgi:signal transduction histidine kinase
MSNRQLKWISVLLPTVFMAGVLYLRFNFVPPERTLEGNLYAVLAVILGGIAFSILFFGVIERREAEIIRSGKELDALHQAALTLTTELDLQVVLQKVVDISRDLLNAKYGALGIHDPDSNIILQFITTGITPEDQARIGPPPKGHGLLGVLSPGGETLIVDDIKQDPRSVGFPPNHPPMKSLLGVPIKSKGEVFGNLYVADKLGRGPVGTEVLLNFNQSDRALLEKFATQAAIAIENAQLYRKTQELAVVHERERFGMALHDGIMQSVYATGLSLQEAQHHMESKPEEAGQRINQAIQELGQVLRDLRNYILGLRTGRYQGQDLATSLGQMAQELHANTLMNVNFTPPTKITVVGLDVTQTDELVHISREILTNIRKHSYARNVEIALKREGELVVLSFQDDGIGFDQQTDSPGYGLGNMRERAEGLNAEIKIISEKSKGTSIDIRIPVPFYLSLQN